MLLNGPVQWEWMMRLNARHFGPSAQVSDDETALLKRRAGVHVAATIDVIIDLGGGADHPAV